MVRTPDQIVTDFLATWHESDAGEMASFFTDDGEYQNVPRDPAVGRDAVRAYMERLTEFLEMTGVEVHRQISSGSVVMNERTDFFRYNGKEVAMPVVGVFEIEGDKIKKWRDYADSAQLADL